MADDTTLKIKSALAALFGNAAVQPEEASGGDDAVQVTQDQIDQRGRNLLAIRGSMLSGQIKLFDLEVVKAKLGASWDRKLDHVHMVCETVLKRHLGNRHFFYKATDTSYVVVFDLQDKTAATVASRAIAQEILAKILGQDAANLDMTIEINLTEIFAADVPPDANLLEVMEKQFATAPVEHVSSKSVDTPRESPDGKGSQQASVPAAPTFAPISRERGSQPASTARGLQELLDASERSSVTWQHEIAKQMTTAAGTRKTISDAWPTSKKASTHVSQAEVPLVTAFQPPQAARVIANRDGLGIEVAGIDFSYSPIWSAGKKAVISYHLNMTMRAQDGHVITPEEALGGTGHMQLIRTVDRLMMKRGLADLTRAVGANRKYIACIPVTSFSLLEGYGVPTLFDMLTGLANPLPQLLVLDVVDALAMERKDLMLCAAAAAGKCRYLLLRASLDQTNFGNMAHRAVQAVGGSLNDHAWSEKDATKKLDTFVASAAKATLESFIFGVNTRSMAFAAIAAGFDYLSGPAIAADTIDPSGVAPIDMLGLFRKSD